MRPVIGITGNRRNGDQGREELWIPSTYGDAVRLGGGLPIFLQAASEDAETLAEIMDGLLLSGGGDLDPRLYGRTNAGSEPPDPQRDAFELAVFAAMRRRGKPVLGICRGMQVIQCAMGGELIQDISRALGIEHPSDPAWRHEVCLTEESFLSTLFPTQFLVNSTHHQAVGVPAPGLRACALGAQGSLVEAVEAADGSPVWGVQWHPERLTDQVGMRGLFTMLSEACLKG